MDFLLCDFPYTRNFSETSFALLSVLFSLNPLNFHTGFLEDRSFQWIKLRYILKVICI